MSSVYNILKSTTLESNMSLGYIFVEHIPQEVFAEQRHLRQRFLFDRSDPALRIGIQIQRPGWQDDTLDTGIINDLLKGGAVFPVPVVDEILPGRQEAPLFHRHVAGGLHHPSLIGMRRHTSNMNFPTAQMQEKQDVVCHEPTQRPDLGSKKVGGDQHVQMRTKEFFPRGGRLALWCWRYAMALEDVAHRLVTDRQA